MTSPAAKPVADPVPWSMDGTGGVRLRALSWPAEGARGRVLLVHGLGDHAARWDQLAGALQRRGYSVAAYDQRGHGRSGGRRVYVERFDLLVEDLRLVLEATRQGLRGPGEPFLYGHSMGALVVLRYLQTFGPPPPGAVLSAPWLATAVRIPAWKEVAASVLRRLAPWIRIPTSIPAGDLTSDEALQRLYDEDRLIARGISVGLYDAVLEAQRHALAAPPPTLPLLVLLPVGDPVAEVRTTVEWAERAGPLARTVRLEGMHHEPHNELDRERVFRLVGEWLDLRTPGRARG